MEKLFQKSLKSSISYAQYIAIMKDYAENSKTSGVTVNENLIRYTKLNWKRMQRWNKTLSIENSAEDFFKLYTSKITFLALTETWCGDAAHLLPMVQKITLSNPNFNFALLFRDTNAVLMQKFLTNGSKSIPKIIVLTQTNKVLFTYGPRPSTLTKLVEKEKQEAGILSDNFKVEIQKWYTKDKGQTICNDLKKLLKT